MTARRSLTVFALLVACGPGLPGDTTTTVDTTSTASTTTAASESSTGAPTPTTSGAPTTSDTSTTSDTGCSFLDCTTGSQTTCFLESDKQLRCSMCDLWTQDCPNGQKCNPWSNDGSGDWTGNKCVEILPNAGKPGDPCIVEGGIASGHDSCDKAAMCWNVDPDTFAGTCVALCTGSPDAPQCDPPGTTCVIAKSGLLSLCLPPCDPLLQDCPPLDVCVPTEPDGTFACFLDQSGDAGPLNGSCLDFNTCDPGLACVDPSLASECDPMASGCCLPFCDLMNPVCTNQGATCLPWYEPGTAPQGLENVGLCGLMP